jgi:hypothetical protein
MTTTLRAMRAAALLLAAAAVGLAACGDSDEEKVRDTLDRFATATREKDYQALCDDLFARALVRQVRSVGLPCEVALRTGLGQVRRPTLTVRSVEVNDDGALARVRTGAAGQKPSEDTVRLVKEDDDWRVASLAAPQPQPPDPAQP